LNIHAVAILALTLSAGVGRLTINRLTDWAEATGRSLTDLMDGPEQDLYEVVPVELGGGADALVRCSEGNLSRARSLIERVEKLGGQVISRLDGDYPKGLAASLGDAAPPLLFVAGNFDLLHTENAGIVGTRRPSATGVHLAEQCARTFCEAGVPVLSGGAVGVDMVAHEGALRAGGQTVVVLPQGLLTYRVPKELLGATEEGDVLLVSEFSPDAKWSTPGALTRNATIAALCRLVCVIEPGETGGSLGTARHALDQMKHVVVHGRKGGERAAKALEGRGAVRLLDEDGRFSSERLLEAWAAVLPKPVEQSDLF